MKLFRSILTVSLLGLALANGARAEGPEPMHQRIKARLEKLADRLEIRPSQQAAWEAYENSVESLGERRMKKPGMDADAAAIAKFRAERMEAFARKLEGVADSTAKLESVLDQNQRKILDRMTRRSMEKARRRRFERG